MGFSQLYKLPRQGTIQRFWKKRSDKCTISVFTSLPSPHPLLCIKWCNRNKPHIYPCSCEKEVGFYFYRFDNCGPVNIYLQCTFPLHVLCNKHERKKKKMVLPTSHLLSVAQTFRPYSERHTTAFQVCLQTHPLICSSDACITLTSNL